MGHRGEQTKNRFVNALEAAGQSLGPTNLESGGATGLDAPLGGFLRGFAAVRGQERQQQQQVQAAELARSRGEFEQSKTLLNLAKVGQEGAIGRGLLQAQFGGNVPAPIEAALREQQGMDLSAAQQNQPIYEAFIAPLVDRGMLGETDEENMQSAQHWQSIISSLKPASAATAGRLFSESVVAGRTVFGMQELSPFIEEAIENKEDTLGREEREFRRLISAANRRPLRELLKSSDVARVGALANRPVATISDAELQSLPARNILPSTIKMIRQAREAAVGEVKNLRKQERAAAAQRMTIRRPDWPATTGAFDQTYHADNLNEGVTAALLAEVKEAGMVNLSNPDAIVREVQALARDRFWDDAEAEHIIEVMKLDPTISHLVAPEPLGRLDIPGVGIIDAAEIEFHAKEQGMTPEAARQFLIDNGAVPVP